MMMNMIIPRTLITQRAFIHHVGYETVRAINVDIIIKDLLPTLLLQTITPPLLAEESSHAWCELQYVH